MECWRANFPEVRAAYAWLEEMYWRLQHCIPPVSEAEFNELAA
ncbi:hypothetical protein FRUB_05969 [Fimbriiglobus ruber]|uniref:Mobile element protein n=1 Tax=Fimbriiglobus ruber TaxID=1908690 RepID=A0A225DPJ7_9BACT|nr:hypothetical protein FRUB_05969 [Fimbriiglobus ruber]